MAEPSEPAETKPPASPTHLGRVGDGLRRAFDQAATEPLPKAFEELLRQLR